MNIKVFLAAAIFACGISLLQAQPNRRPVSFSVSLEPHLNWIHTDESFLENGPVRLGIVGGFRIDYRFQKFLAFSTGLCLNQTGGNIIYNMPLYLDRTKGLDTLQTGTRVNYRLQFIEIPVALKIMLPEIGYYTGFAEVGLDPMYNTRAMINATDNNIENESFRQGVSRVNLAWHAGLGLNYSLGGIPSLQFTIIYQNTFLDVTRENHVRKADNARINQVGLKIGVIF